MWLPGSPLACLRGGDGGLEACAAVEQRGGQSVTQADERDLGQAQARIARGHAIEQGPDDQGRGPGFDFSPDMNFGTDAATAHTRIKRPDFVRSTTVVCAHRFSRVKPNIYLTSKYYHEPGHGLVSSLTEYECRQTGCE